MMVYGKLMMIIGMMVLVMGLTGCRQEAAMKRDGLRRLTPEEERVIVYKGTEAPFSGTYHNYFEAGIYRCKQCSTALYRSSDKFASDCGWPSFDDEIPGAVKRVPDAAGHRTEIVCAVCGAHLGHLFEQEGFTPKNIRHCVNSISLLFEPESAAVNSSSVSDHSIRPEAKAYFAGGCFWGVEYYFEHFDGVLSAVSGYMGGDKADPTYKEVCSGSTGHLEVVEVTYDPRQVSYESLARFFFEIHDPTQADGQGPDIGEQYRSLIFYSNEEEKQTAQKLIHSLQTRGYDVVTRLHPAGTFWKAEEYHQDYYRRKGQEPYCHVYRKRF